MNIVFVANLPSPYRVDFFNELGKHCNLTVIYELEREIGRDAKWIAGETRNFNEIHLNAHPFWHPNTSLSVGIISVLSKLVFDMVIFGVPSSLTELIGIEYLIHKKIPYVISEDGGFVPKKRKPIVYELRHRAYSNAAACITTSDEAERFLRYYGAGNPIYRFPFSSIHEEDIISDEERIRQHVECRNELKLSERKICLMVSQFIHRKGIDVLLKSANLLTDEYGIYIIGGKATDEYLRYVKKSNLMNVHFVDFLVPNDLCKFYLAADCFVLPTRHDEWGLVVNEAMAKGLPVITTNMCLAGTEMIKNGENGYVIPPDDEIMLAEKIKCILGDEDLQKKMSASSIATAKKYTIETMAEAHIEILNKIIS